MPTVFHDSLSFSGWTWTLKLLPSKHTNTSIWYARPLANQETTQNAENLVIGKVSWLSWWHWLMLNNKGGS